MKFRLTSLARLLLILTFGTVATPAWADTITVLNPSFEITNPLNIPCSIPANCSFNFGPIPNWTLVGQGGSWHPSSAFLNLPVPDGSLVAYSNGGTISQRLAASLIPNVSYTLAVDVGHRLDGFAANYAIALFAGNMFLGATTGSNTAIPQGQFANETFNYLAGAAPPSGQLGIVLLSTGPQIDFDNVRLTNSVPEPASFVLLAAGLGLLLLVIRRR